MKPAAVFVDVETHSSGSPLVSVRTGHWIGFFSPPQARELARHLRKLPPALEETIAFTWQGRAMTSKEVDELAHRLDAAACGPKAYALAFGGSWLRAQVQSRPNEEPLHLGDIVEAFATCLRVGRASPNEIRRLFYELRGLVAFGKHRAEPAANGVGAQTPFG